jgi:glycolate oxidase FAD binding subunit
VTYPQVLTGLSSYAIHGAPPSDLTVRPKSVEEVAEVLAACAADGLAVLVWGAGTHQGIGNRVDPDVVLSTERLDRVVDHRVDDLTLTVQAGVTVGSIASTLRSHGQMAVLPEEEKAATIGGVLAVGASGYGRLRMGPVRDHLLEVLVATGDGRLVRAGAKVVKHVQGYDLMRLSVGSLGSLGVIVEACLKLWPTPRSSATVEVASPSDAGRAFRPQAVLQTRDRTVVMLTGTAEEVEAQSEALEGDSVRGLLWPDQPRPREGEGLWSVRVPPALVPEVVDRVPGEFVAQHGVGIVEAPMDGPTAAEMRRWVEPLGGAVVLLEGHGGLYADPGPWGSDPSALDLQRRIVARFDPDRVVNPGRPAGAI